MLTLIITCDDPMERLLYGEPDPWLSLWECKHYDAGFPEHTHNDGDGNGDYGIGRPTRPIDLGEEPGTGFVDPSDYNPAPDSDAFNEWRQQQREAADALVQEYEAYADVWRDHREQYQDHPTALLKIDDCPECRRRLDAFRDAYREIVEEEPTADAEADLDRYESVLESPRGRNALLRTKRGLEAWIRYQGERRGLSERAIQAQIAGLRAGDEAAVFQRPGGRDGLAEGVTAGPDGPEYLRGFGAVTDDPSAAVGRISPAGGSAEVLGTAAGGQDARSARLDGFGEVGADAAQGLGDRIGHAQQEAWIRHQAQQKGLTAEQVEAEVEAWRSQRPDDTTLDRRGPDAGDGQTSGDGQSGGDGSQGSADSGPPPDDNAGLTEAEQKLQADAVAAGASEAEVQRRLEEYRNTPEGILDRVRHITSTLSDADEAALEAIANDPQSGRIRITVTGDDGQPREMTLAEYIRDNAIPNTQERVAVGDTHSQITDILAEITPDDVAALEAIANDPERANLPVTVYATDDDGNRIPRVGADGEPVLDADGNPVYETETVTMAEYIRDNVIPNTQERVAVGDTHSQITDILSERDPGDVAALEAIANDPERGQLPVTVYATDDDGNRIPRVGADGEPVLDADGNPVYETETVTMAEYIRDTLIPNTEQRLAVGDTHSQITDILSERDPGDVAALEAIANDPERGQLPVTVYATDDDGNRIPRVGADGEPVLDADGNPVYETETVTMAEYIRERVLLPDYATVDQDVISGTVMAGRQQWVSESDAAAFRAEVQRERANGTLTPDRYAELLASFTNPDDSGPGDNDGYTEYTRYNPATGKFFVYYDVDEDDGGGGGGGGAPIVSTDSNGYTSVRTPEGQTVYDPDGNLVSTQDSQGRDTFNRSDADNNDGRPPAAPPTLDDNLAQLQATHQAANEQRAAAGLPPLPPPTIEYNAYPGAAPAPGQPAADPMQAQPVSIAGSSFAVDPQTGRLVSRQELVRTAVMNAGQSPDWSALSHLAGNDWTALRGAQEAWFRAQLTNLSDDPAAAAAQLAELAERADELSAEWEGRDATFVDADGNPISGAEYFDQISSSLADGAAENASIADRNAALPPATAATTSTSQANPGLGDRFSAAKAAIDARVVAANDTADPAARARAFAEIAADIRSLEQQWAGADTSGWTLGVDHDNDADTPRVATTATEWWGEYAAGVEAAADANRATAEQNTAAAFASDSEALAIAESLGFDVSEITPDQARNLIVGHNEQVERRQEDERERQERTLPGETGQIGTQVQVDPVTGSLQVSPGVMPSAAATAGITPGDTCSAPVTGSTCTWVPI